MKFKSHLNNIEFNIFPFHFQWFGIKDYDAKLEITSDLVRKFE